MKAANRHDLIHRAEQLAARGKLRKALALYLQVLKTDADNPKLLNRAGDLCVRIQKEDEAISLYKRAAGILHRQGFNPQAIALCRKILRLDPRLIDVMEALAELLATQRLVTEAVNQFEALVTYYRNHGHHGKAIRTLDRIVALQPESRSHRLEVAELLEQEGRTEEAQKQYRSVVAIELAGGVAPDQPSTPVAPPATANVEGGASSSSSEEDYVDLAAELAAELIAEGLDAELEAPVACSDQARRGLEEALDPEEGETHFQLGLAYEEMGLIDEAIGELQAAAKHPVYLVRCSLHLADCFVDKGFPRLAIEWLERSLKAPSTTPEEAEQLHARLAAVERPLEPETAPVSSGSPTRPVTDSVD